MIKIAEDYQHKNNDELERHVLGTILGIYELSSAKDLRPNHFADFRNRVIFEIMLDLDRDHQAIDYSAVSEHLKMKGIGDGIAYVKRLRDYGVNKTLLSDLVDILKEQAVSEKRKR